MRLELIDRNPFSSKRISTSLPKPKQKEFVEHEFAAKIIDHLPDAQWRLLFALARWGGLRIPSEPRLLTWNDVNWDELNITVASPKTERHEGHEQRVIPTVLISVDRFLLLAIDPICQDHEKQLTGLKY